MRIHFIAIGGAAMHNLAIALHKNGHHVTGTDDKIFEPSRSRLDRYGLLPKQEGWDTAYITSDIDVIILGMHAKEGNPELTKAQELGLTIYSYPEFLAQHSKEKTRVVIGGSHGKTTTTAMILHVLHYHNIEVDYMVGAQLEGFDTMVHLTSDNEFIVLEGDEYLSSPLDRRPKFHLYQPNIALITGIAWDHINVFPTEEIYDAQFEKFIDVIVNGGVLIYNEEDEKVKQIAENAQKPIRKIPYQTHPYTVHNNTTHLDTPDGEMPIEVFGEHNLSNLSGAKWICQQMGVDQDAFYEAIASFKGASKRLETIYKSEKTVVLKDFAHSPSKVKASTKAITQQYTDFKSIACLELHTFSSLTKEFIVQYKHTLDAAQEAIVFFDPDVIAKKGLSGISETFVHETFAHPNLKVITQTQDLRQELRTKNYENSVLLFMSSGNYAGLGMEEVCEIVKA